jgi:hypothetical protein
MDGGFKRIERYQVRCNRAQVCKYHMATRSLVDSDPQFLENSITCLYQLILSTRVQRMRAQLSVTLFLVVLLKIPPTKANSALPWISASPYGVDQPSQCKLANTVLPISRGFCTLDWTYSRGKGNVLGLRGELRM